MTKKDFHKAYFENGRSKHLVLDRSPHTDLELVVVIPSYNENGLVKSLSSLCQDVIETSRYEILIIENYSRSSDSEIKLKADNNAQLIEEWLRKNPRWADKVFHLICELPTKDAGVGLARKIGMDTAAYRLAELRKPEAVILNYDADCTCKLGYLNRVLEECNSKRKWDAISIYYEHPIDKVEEVSHRNAIVDYELHLRIYIEWQRYLKLPYAFHTIGSAMAARAGVYTRKGGMNRRKAGEDFYFIHKFTHGAFGEVNSTTIFPSCRESSRVPFGTGRAIKQSLSERVGILSYNPHSYLVLSDLIKLLPEIYAHGFIATNLNEDLLSFFEQQDIAAKLIEIKNNTNNYIAFEKRFFQWFDAFLLMKYLHHMRDATYGNVTSLESANVLFRLMGVPIEKTNENALFSVRRIQKEFNVKQP